MTKKNKARIFIVDDHPLVRQGLTGLIGREPDLEVCGESGNAPEALRAIEALKPDLTTADLMLDAYPDLEFIRDIVRRKISHHVLVISMHPEAVYAERAIRAGARGYVTKKDAAETVVPAIRRVLNGGIHVGEPILRRLVEQAASGRTDDGGATESLSDRELEVLHLLGDGHGPGEIADCLHLSEKTVETYKERLKHKLNLKNSSDLRHFAIHWTRAESAGA